ncbi:MAG: excinuclease ABC subunit UvrC [Flavobacteriales bacterium]|nr:excinuclease ABC subunit UvrC [Flavobacteriales bacterium]MDW8432834.1 excinuclease ABC subunit UvrC [Flavobacteriales bacterium]
MPEVMTVSEVLEATLKAMPTLPGVYKFLDAEAQVIYVGKAKNLKARVSSYFNSLAQASGKTRHLVRRIHSIEYIVTRSESDALLLENNLIKNLQPRYNINLKDDKSYPYIVVRREPFPRVYPTRRFRPEEGEYFGPYTSVGAMRATLALVKSLFKLRTCNLNLSPESISRGRYKVCLEYHIGNCAAPCVGLQSQAEYDETLRQVRQILQGRYGQLRDHLTRAMQDHAARLAFEDAQRCKEMLEKLDRFREKTAVVTREVEDADVFFMDVQGEEAVLSYLRVTEGYVVQGFSTEVKRQAGESPEDVLATMILQIRDRVGSSAPLIITNLLPEFTLPGVRLEVPGQGEKKRLLDLAERNAQAHKMSRLKQLAVTQPEEHTRRLLSTVQQDLRLHALPVRIECFDNSNFQGAHPVAAMVCFVDGKPARSEYRIFNIKTVQGPDDFATMREVILRRYGRLLEEKKALPDLVVIDGGKGQLNAALESLRTLGLEGRIQILSIAKRLEEIYYPGDELPLHLNKKSETLRLLQRLRDEAHRFGLKHYRQKHRKTLTRTSLEDIPGIGPASSQKLLRHFKSLARLRQATEEEIAQVVGWNKARGVCAFLRQPSGPSETPDSSY